MFQICNCLCHSGVGMLHIVECCRRCPKCNQRIPFQDLKEHTLQCSNIKELLSNIDAKVWADKFLKVSHLKPELVNDKEYVATWFANAIMAGYDHAKAIR